MQCSQLVNRNYQDVNTSSSYVVSFYDSPESYLLFNMVHVCNRFELRDNSSSIISSPWVDVFSESFKEKIVQVLENAVFQSYNYTFSTVGFIQSSITSLLGDFKKEICSFREEARSLLETIETTFYSVGDFMFEFFGDAIVLTGEQLNLLLETKVSQLIKSIQLEDSDSKLVNRNSIFAAFLLDADCYFDETTSQLVSDFESLQRLPMLSLEGSQAEVYTAIRQQATAMHIPFNQLRAWYLNLFIKQKVSLQEVL